MSSKQAAPVDTNSVPTPPKISPVRKDPQPLMGRRRLLRRSIGDIFLDLRSAFLGNDSARWGEMVEYWSDLLVGYEPVGQTFWEQFIDVLLQKDASSMEYKLGWLTGRGVFTQKRQVAVLRRGLVSVTSYVATQGDDLFLSYRAFIRRPLSWFRQIVLWLFAGVLGYWLSFNYYFSPYTFSFFISYEVNQAGRFFLITSAIVILLYVIFGIAGAIRSKGDFLAFFRMPVSTLYYDDLTSLTARVHRSFLDAADLVGIDKTVIAPRQQPLQGWKARF